MILLSVLMTFSSLLSFIALHYYVRPNNIWQKQLLIAPPVYHEGIDWFVDEPVKGRELVLVKSPEETDPVLPYFIPLSFVAVALCVVFRHKMEKEAEAKAEARARERARTITRLLT